MKPQTYTPSTSGTAQFGIVGIGYMGENLALNVRDHGYRVAVWDHSSEMVNSFLDRHGQDRHYVVASTLEEFVPALTPPRQVLIMVPAGAPVDQVLTIAAAVNARMVSDNRSGLTDSVKAALSAATICSYAQGMSLLRTASGEYGWHVDLREVARIWKGGCIIRAAVLDAIMETFEREHDLPSLLVDPEICQRVLEAERAWRSTLQWAVHLGVPVPAMSASLAYFDSYRAARLPQNLTQAQRDFFGAHGYHRIDRPASKSFHTEWRRLVGGAWPISSET